MKKLLALVCSLALMISFVGCAASTSSRKENHLYIAKEVDCISMNSMYATDGMSFETIHSTIDGLMNVDAEGNLIPGLAESYTESEDGLVYTFTLRDAKWSNDVAVTAHDFVFAWNTAIVNPAAEYAYLYGESGANVAGAEEILADPTAGELGIKAIDAKTLEVTLTKRTPYFLSLMAFPVFFPVNEEFFNAQGEDGKDYAIKPENMLSCGAFIMTSWVRDSKMEFKKNPTYWDADAVKVDGLVVNITKDSSAAAIAFEGGDVDFTKIVSTQIDKYKDQETFTQLLDGYLWYLQPNLNNEVMANKNLRLALAYATSKEELCEAVLKDGSIPGNGFVPSKLATGPDGKDFRETAGDTFATDLAKAQECFDLAKAELGMEEIEIELMYETADPALTAAQYLQMQLEKNIEGLKVKLNAQSKEARIELQKDREFEIVLTRWGPDYADPTTYLNLMITGNSYNYGDWSNADFDAKMQEAGNTADLAARWDMLVEAEKIIVEDCPVMPVFQVGGASLIADGVTGIEVHSVGVPYVYKNANLNK